MASNLQTLLYAAPFILTGVAAIIVVILFQRKKNIFGARWLTILLIASAVWSLAQAFEYLHPEMAAKIFWDNLQWLGIVIIPSAFLLLALEFNGKDRWIKQLIPIIMVFFPVLILLLVYTNQTHHFIVSEYHLIELAGFVGMDKDYSIGFWLFLGYSYLLFIMGFIFLVKLGLHPKKFYGNQVRWTIFAALITVIVSVFDTTGLNPFPHFQPTVLAMSGFTLAVVSNLSNLRRLDINKSSGNFLLESIPDPIFLFTDTNHVIDLNSAAQNLIGKTTQEVVGNTLAQVTPDLFSQISPQLHEIDQIPGSPLEIKMASIPYQASLYTNLDHLGRMQSHVLMLSTQQSAGKITADLQRSRALVQALSKVSTQVASVSSPDQVFETMAQELDKLSLKFTYITFDNQKEYSTIQKASFDLGVLRPLEKLVGKSFIGFTIHQSHWPLILEELDNQYPLFIPNFAETIRPAYQQFPDSIFSAGLELVGISAKTPGLFIPISFSTGTTGFLAIWGDSLVQQDLVAYSIFGSQVNSAIEQAILKEAEQIQLRELERANALVMALTRVATQVSSSFDPQNVLQILSDELNLLNLDFYFCVLDKDQKSAEIKFVSPASAVLRKLEKVFGDSVIGYKLPHEAWPPLAVKSLKEKKAVFVQEFAKDARNIFFQYPDAMAKRGLEMVRIFDNTVGIHVTHKFQEGTTGVLSIWGKDIKKTDVPTFSVFASQVAGAFEQAYLYEAEQEYARKLKRSNSLVEALSRVAASVASSTNPDLVIESLGAELKKIGLDSLVVMLDPETEQGYIRYHSMELGLLRRAEKITNRKFSEQRLPLQQWPPIFQNVFEFNEAIYVEEFSGTIRAFMGSSIPNILAKSAMKAVGIIDETKGYFLPLEIKGKTFGCLSVWDDTLGESYLPAFRVFASQVAIAFENARLLEAEQQQARELERSNNLLGVLSRIAARVTATIEREDLMVVMKEELSAINLDFVYFNINPERMETSVEFITLSDEKFNQLQRIVKIRLQEQAILFNFVPKEMQKAFIAKQPTFIHSFGGFLNNMFPEVSQQNFAKILEITGTTKNTSGISLPIGLGDGSIMGIIIWGETLHQDDVAAFQVYKNQMESILETSRLFYLADQEISERKMVQEALAISKEEYRGLFENAHDAIIISDPYTKKILEVNERACEIFGYSHEEFIHIKMDAIQESPDDWNIKVFEIIRSETHLNFELVQFRKNDTSPMEIEINAGIVTYNHKPAIQSIHRDVTERNKMEAQLRHDTLHDSLTNLPNRTLFLNRLNHLIARSRRMKDYSFAVLFVDLDRFKDINDSMGHLIGDQLLVDLSKRLLGNMRTSDTIARMGGDEFAILLEDIHSVHEVNISCQRIISAIEMPITLGDHEAVLSGSIGVVMGSPDYTKPEDYLRDADIAMYQAKALGRARFDIFDITMRTSVMDRLQLEKNLRVAVTKNEFFLLYQPIISLYDQQLIGFEALIRWEQPDQGLISPTRFIPVAEDLGLIHSIGHWVLEEACTQLQYWQEDYDHLGHLTLNINVSAVQLLRSDFPDEVKTVLDNTRICPNNLALEITETALIHDQEIVSRQVKALKEIGVQIHLDDFGTGYSSLSFINLFQIDALKIERQFVGGLEKRKNAELVNAIVALGERLNLNVIAEGIETQAQLDMLKKTGCKLGQGYFYSRPISSYEASSMIETYNLIKLSVLRIGGE